MADLSTTERKEEKVSAVASESDGISETMIKFNLVITAKQQHHDQMFKYTEEKNDKQPLFRGTLSPKGCDKVFSSLAAHRSQRLVNVDLAKQYLAFVGDEVDRILAKQKPEIKAYPNALSACYALGKFSVTTDGTTVAASLVLKQQTFSAQMPQRISVNFTQHILADKILEQAARADPKLLAVYESTQAKPEFIRGQPFPRVEGDRVEFKLSRLPAPLQFQGARDLVTYDGLVKTICAYLNCTGGSIYIGVHDNGTVFGVSDAIAKDDGKIDCPFKPYGCNVRTDPSRMQIHLGTYGKEHAKAAESAFRETAKKYAADIRAATSRIEAALQPQSPTHITPSPKRPAKGKTTTPAPTETKTAPAVDSKRLVADLRALAGSLQKASFVVPAERKEEPSNCIVSGRSLISFVSDSVILEASAPPAAVVTGGVQMSHHDRDQLERDLMAHLRKNIQPPFDPMLIECEIHEVRDDSAVSTFAALPEDKLPADRELAAHIRRLEAELKSQRETIEQLTGYGEALFVLEIRVAKSTKTHAYQDTIYVRTGGATCKMSLAEQLERMAASTKA